MSSRNSFKKEKKELGSGERIKISRRKSKFEGEPKFLLLVARTLKLKRTPPREDIIVERRPRVFYDQDGSRRCTTASASEKSGSYLAVYVEVS